jgi:D-psicose/D-tagatose/L-ribulose 3-epimerase
MNKIGFNLLVWSGGLPDTFLQITERLKKIGYDGIEVFMAEQDKTAYSRLGNHLKSIGLEATCVLGVGPEENPISDSKLVRSKAVDRLKLAVDCAHAIESKIICGPFHSAFADFSNRHPPEDKEYGWSAEVLHAAGEYSAKADIVLTIEALNRFECFLCNTMDQLTGLIKRADHPNVKAMFDTHHANIEEKKIETALKKVTIEAFTRNDPDFANAINVWREYSEPWDMAEGGLKFIHSMCKKHGL